MSYRAVVARELSMQNLGEKNVPNFWKIVDTAVEWGLEIELTTKTFREKPFNVFPIYNGSLFFIGRSRSNALCTLNDDASSRVAGRLSMHENLVRYNHVSGVNNYSVKHDGEINKMLHCDGKEGSLESSVNLELWTVISFSHLDGVKTSFELRLNSAVKATLVRCMQAVVAGVGDLEYVLNSLKPKGVEAPVPVFQPMPRCRPSDPRDYLTHKWLSTIRPKHTGKRTRETETRTDAEVMTDDIKKFSDDMRKLAQINNPAEGVRVFKSAMLLKFHSDKRFDDSEEMMAHARCMLEKVQNIVV